MAALQANFLADDLAGTLQKFRRPRGSHAQTCRKNGRSDGHVSVWCFLGQKQRNAQSRVLLDVFLQGISSHRRQFGCQTVFERFLRPRVGAISRPKHSDVPLGNVFFERFRRHYLLYSFTPRLLNRIIIPRHRAAQLPDFLLHRHPTHQVAQSFFDGQGSVLIG